MMEPQNTARTTIYLDEEVKKRLQRRADRHRQSMSGAANILLTNALDAEDQARGKSRTPEG